MQKTIPLDVTWTPKVAPEVLEMFLVGLWSMNQAPKRGILPANLGDLRSSSWRYCQEIWDFNRLWILKMEHQRLDDYIID